METEKMIEEMAKAICPSFNKKTDCETCLTEWCYAEEYATMLYCAGYRKIPEGAVVLTKEAQERIEQRVSALEKKADALKQVRKETASEFAEMAKQAFLEMKGISFDEWRLYQYKIDEIAKQFGVEIEG